MGESNMKRFVLLLLLIMLMPAWASTVTDPNAPRWVSAFFWSESRDQVIYVKQNNTATKWVDKDKGKWINPTSTWEILEGQGVLDKIIKGWTKEFNYHDFCMLSKHWRPKVVVVEDPNDPKAQSKLEMISWAMVRGLSMETRVFVTPSGNRFHKSLECQYTKTAEEVTLSEAIQAYKLRCSTCWR